MKDVEGRILFLLLLALLLAREGGASGGRVAVRKGGVAVVKCQFPGESGCVLIYYYFCEENNRVKRDNLLVL